MTSSGAVSGKSKAEQRGYPELPEMLWKHLIGHNLTPLPPKCVCPPLALVASIQRQLVVIHWKPMKPGEKGIVLGGSVRGSYIGELFDLQKAKKRIGDQSQGMEQSRGGLQHWEEGAESSI